MSTEKAVYVQLMENILEKIRTGEYRVGEKIMSERQMAQQYGINRLTVRNAIKKLVEEGTLVSIQGKGTFVSRLPKNEKKVVFGDNENVSLSQSLVQSGFQSSRTVLSFKKIENQGETRDYFPDSPQLYELIRLSRIDGQPYALQICYFPASLFKQPERFNFGEGSLYTYMELEGHMPKTIISDMEVQEVPAAYRQVMEAGPKKLIFAYEYFGFDEQHRLVEFTKAYYMPEFTSFKYVTKK